MLHIDLPTQAQIEQLFAYRGGPAVSIYLRTTPLTQDSQADRIELKNQLRTAVEEMESSDAAKRVIRSIAESIELVIEDDAFWTEQANSLAIFAWPEGIRTFRLPNRLTNFVEVSDRFHVKPLIRSVTFPHHAYVLAIGVGAVRLIEVSADLPPHVVPVPGLPRSMADALGKRSHLERTDGMRSGLSTSESGMLTRYARIVDQALRPVLTGHEWPLLLAAPDPLAPAYRAVNSYAHLAAQGIPGSADHTPDHELAAQARTLLDEIYASQIRDIGALFAARSAHGRATTDIAQAARAATFGAIDTLLVDMDAVVPGTVADEDGAVTFADQPGPDNYGVVDEIARRAMQSGARVIAARQADIPQGAPLAALLRYAI